MTATRKTLADDINAAQTEAGAMLSHGAQAVKDAANSAQDGAASRLADVKAKAGQALTDAKEAVVTTAGSAASGLRDIAVEKADAARETLSDVGARLAATLERSAADDASGQGGLKSQVLTSVADGLSRASEGLRQRSVADLAEDVRVLARRHPGAFMAAAAVAGFAAARFVRSSARRQAAMDVVNSLRGPRS